MGMLWGLYGLSKDAGRAYWKLSNMAVGAAVETVEYADAYNRASAEERRSRAYSGGGYSGGSRYDYPPEPKPRTHGPARPAKVAKGRHFVEDTSCNIEPSAQDEAVGEKVTYGAYEYPCQRPVMIHSLQGGSRIVPCGAPTKWSVRYPDGVEKVADPKCSVGHLNSQIPVGLEYKPLPVPYPEVEIRFDWVVSPARDKADVTLSEADGGVSARVQPEWREDKSRQGQWLWRYGVTESPEGDWVDRGNYARTYEEAVRLLEKELTFRKSRQLREELIARQREAFDNATWV